jgi:hypothetical protein
MNKDEIKTNVALYCDKIGLDEALRPATIRYSKSALLERAVADFKERNKL